MSIEVRAAETKVARIIDAIYALKIKLPVSEHELSCTLARVPRICLDEISSDLSSSNRERHREGLSHLMEHLHLSVCLELPLAEDTPDIGETAYDGKAQQLSGAVAVPAEVTGPLSADLGENEEEDITLNILQNAPVETDNNLTVVERATLEPEMPGESSRADKTCGDRGSREEEDILITPRAVSQCSNHRTSQEEPYVSSRVNMRVYAGRQLTDHLLEMNHLHGLSNDLQDYADSKSPREKTKLARRIIEALWEDRQMGEEIRELSSISDGFEPILDTTFSNSHFVQQLDTYLLGCLVLRELEIELGKADRLDILGKHSESISLAWLMTGSIYSTGYMLEYGRRIMDKLSHLYSRIGMDRFSHLYGTNAQFAGIYDQQNLEVGDRGQQPRFLNVPGLVIESIMNGVHTDRSALDKMIEEKWNQQDRGLVAAAILWRTLLLSGRVRQEEDSAEHTALKSASTAVALHSFGSDDLRFTVDFDRLPYAFLLMTINELQEWSIPGAGISDRQSCFDLSSVELVGSAGRRTIKLVFSASGELDADAVQELRDQIIGKRRKLANLAYGSAANCREVEIHADYEAGREQLGSITVLLLHRT